MDIWQVTKHLNRDKLKLNKLLTNIEHTHTHTHYVDDTKMKQERCSIYRSCLHRNGFVSLTAPPINLASKQNDFQLKTICSRSYYIVCVWFGSELLQIRAIFFGRYQTVATGE